MQIFDYSHLANLTQIAYQQVINFDELNEIYVTNVLPATSSDIKLNLSQVLSNINTLWDKPSNLYYMPTGIMPSAECKAYCNINYTNNNSNRIISIYQ